MSGKRFAILCCLMLASGRMGAIVTIVVLEAPPTAGDAEAGAGDW